MKAGDNQGNDTGVFTTLCVSPKIPTPSAHATIRCKRKPGNPFTLIELLVVIAVIAILAALLFPALGKAKAFTYQAVCMSNQKQMMLLTLQYADENDGSFPFQRYSVGQFGNPIAEIASRLKIKWDKNAENTWRETIVICPGDKRQLGTPGPAGGGTDKVTQAGWSNDYSGNHTGWGNYVTSSYGSTRDVFSTTFPDQWRFNHFKRPACRSAFYDSWGLDLYPNTGQYARHRNGGNFTFVDGHVEWMMCGSFSNWMYGSTYGGTITPIRSIYTNASDKPWR